MLLETKEKIKQSDKKKSTFDSSVRIDEMRCPSDRY